MLDFSKECGIMVSYKPTEDNLQKFLEGKEVAEVLFLRDSAESPYGSGSNIYIRTADGFELVIETDYAELTLTKKE